MPPNSFRLNVLTFSILIIVLTYSWPSSAAIRTVTDLGDTTPGGSPGQLRFEINAAAPGDTIVIPAGTITLTGPAGEDANAGGDLDIVKNLTIQGAGAGATVIDGGGIDKVLHILSGATVAISDLTISGGVAPIEFLTRGGGVFNENGTLALTNCAISNNSVGGGSGGGVYNSGTLTITNCAISGNSAGSGGGIWNNGALTITNSTLSGNAATLEGGGLSNLGGTVTATNVTISGNTSDGNGGGAIGNGSTTMNNVTITNNIADSDNNGSGDGGGIWNGGTHALLNTILAGNTDTGGQAPDCSAGLTSQGHNLVGNKTGCTVTATTGDLFGTGASPINPQLGPLANNGGTTQTHALLSGSPAINAGDSAGCPATDQRGIARPQGVACDIGAYEVLAVDPAAVSAFVTRLYQTVLLREPDPAGLAAHIQNIQQFGTVIPTVLAFFHSQEFLNQALSDTQFLDRLYHTFLNRAPDPEGLAAFLGLLASGCRTRDTLIADLTFSPEFKALLPPVPAADPRVPFVAELYAWILNRPADLPGLQFFVSQLQRSTVLSTVLSFVHSAEFTTPRRSATDYVSALYLVALGRAPDCPGLAGWVATLTPDTDAKRDQLLAQFAASAEFQMKLDQLFP